MGHNRRATGNRLQGSHTEGLIDATVQEQARATVQLYKFFISGRAMENNLRLNPQLPGKFVKGGILFPSADNMVSQIGMHFQNLPEDFQQKIDPLEPGQPPDRDNCAFPWDYTNRECREIDSGTGDPGRRHPVNSLHFSGGKVAIGNNPVTVPHQCNVDRLQEWPEDTGKETLPPWL